MGNFPMLTVFADDLASRSPAQQLLDRFLIGYPRDGAFRRPPYAVTLVGAPGPERDRRVEQKGLRVATTARGASALLIVGADVEQALSAVRPGARVFVYGLLAQDTASATKVRALAARRKIALIAGGAVATTWRMPAVDLPAGTPLDEALMVVGGHEPDRELVGLDGILPLLERRAPGRRGVRAVRAVTWKAFYDALGDEISPRLLASALSRSHSPLGASVHDGRTQDLMKPGLLAALARDPVAYLVEHRDGLRSAVLLLDGVIADLTFALRTRAGEVISARLHRGAEPAQQHFDRLADAIEQHLGGRAPWSADRAVLCAGLHAAFRRARERPGETLATPELTG
jgi:hypothetical protein